MKNVTDSLRPSDSRAVAVANPLADWNCPEFTITLSAYYTGEFSRYAAKAREYMVALEELKKEAIARGYTIYEEFSMDTMNTNIRFRRTCQPIPPKVNRIEESAPIEAEQVIEVKRIG